MSSAPRYGPLLCLAGLHMLVDTCAFLVEPLWGELKSSFQLSGMALFGVITAQSLAPSLSQGAFGLFRDRFAARYLLWVGPFVAAGCLSAVGFVENVYVLTALLIAGGIGVGAFHPEAAVSAGRVWTGARTRGLSLFQVGGTLGLGTSPLLSGLVVDRFGLKGLVLLGPPIVLLAILLNLRVRPHLPPEERTPPAGPADRTGTLRARWPLALGLLAVTSLRIVPNMAMPKVLALSLDARGFDASTIGTAQTVFLVSGGAGMILLALRFPTGWEQRFMVWCPLACVPCLLVLGISGLPLWGLLLVLVPSGLVIWGTTPVIVSFAHQHFPRSAGTASALTMGVSWGTAGVIQARLTTWFDALGAAEQTLPAVVPCVLLSAAGAWLLPKPLPDGELDPSVSSETVGAEAGT